MFVLCPAPQVGETLFGSLEPQKDPIAQLLGALRGADEKGRDDALWDYECDGRPGPTLRFCSGRFLWEAHRLLDELSIGEWSVLVQASISAAAPLSKVQALANLEFCVQVLIKIHDSGVRPEIRDTWRDSVFAVASATIRSAERGVGLPGVPSNPREALYNDMIDFARSYPAFREASGELLSRWNSLDSAFQKHADSYSAEYSSVIQRRRADIADVNEALDFQVELHAARASSPAEMIANRIAKSASGSLWTDPCKHLTESANRNNLVVNSEIEPLLPHLLNHTRSIERVVFFDPPFIADLVQADSRFHRSPDQITAAVNEVLSRPRSSTPNSLLQLLGFSDSCAAVDLLDDVWNALGTDRKFEVLSSDQRPDINTDSGTLLIASGWALTTNVFAANVGKRIVFMNIPHSSSQLNPYLAHLPASLVRRGAAIAAAQTGVRPGALCAIEGEVVQDVLFQDRSSGSDGGIELDSSLIDPKKPAEYFLFRRGFSDGGDEGDPAAPVPSDGISVAR